MSAKKNKKAKAPAEPTGLTEIDRLANLSPVGIQDYVAGVSAYIRQQSTLAKGPKKAAQIRLSNALARALADELVAKVPTLKDKLVTDEQKVAGGLRTANADVSESHKLDGLRLAVELKPINLAVGRAIWNRFGDIRTFAVNIHLKFPFAVVGGVLVIPTYEETGSTAAEKAEQKEAAQADGHEVDDEATEATTEPEKPPIAPSGRKSTVHLIERAIDRLIRAGGRKSEAEAAHLLEGIAVVVYEPDTATIRIDLPKKGSGLRWDEFVDSLAGAYAARFEA
ncbi:hypothetical protein [Elioraea sp.]|uniref:hypothetical protein n=1 Tax=Elioraea sp. TaxID=2185103 RepID=UPI0025BF7F07|nr:hypothetical protein [Elioraea sp.]